MQIDKLIDWISLTCLEKIQGLCKTKHPVVKLSDGQNKSVTPNGSEKY